MLSLTIKDTKNFMSQLLIKEAFDGLFLSEAVIKQPIPIPSAVNSTKISFPKKNGMNFPKSPIRDGLLSSHSASSSSKAVRSLPI